MVEPPRVSVVIPCHNGARFLREAIDSCLRQTMTDFEVVVVDDASPDNCAEIARRYASQDDRVRLICRPRNGGVSEAFNTGFAAARGRIFTRLAQDDVFCPDALRRLADCLDSNPEIGLVYGDCARIDQHGARFGTIRTPEPAAALLFGNRMGLCVAWRRQVWEQIGSFDPGFDAAEDYEYWVRVWNSYPIIKCLGEPLLLVRLHAERGSLVFCEKQERAMLRVLREHYPTRIAPRWRRKFCQREAISRILFGAATDYRRKGQTRLALSRLGRSFLAWPFPYKRRDARSPFPRLKYLLLLVRSTLLSGL